MIEKRVLRQLVLQAFEKEPKTSYDPNLFTRITSLAIEQEVFPQEYYPPANAAARRYKGRDTDGPQFRNDDLLQINEIVWDLIVERILTVGMDTNNQEWPWLRLTDFGRDILSGAASGYYDPDEYGSLLKSLAPDVDAIILQYALEGVRSFRQNLFFASAVMFGAAAEKAVLLLLESIGMAHIDLGKKKLITDLLDRPRLPTIFQTIDDTIRQLIDSNTLSYSVHQGSTQHLLSFMEMIRVQRNDAVHPTAGRVSKEKVFLVMQTFPGSLEVTYRLIGWFSTHTI